MSFISLSMWHLTLLGAIVVLFAFMANDYIFDLKFAVPNAAVSAAGFFFYVSISHLYWLVNAGFSFCVHLSLQGRNNWHIRNTLQQA